MKTIVIFRKFRDGDILALFPLEPGAPGYCSSYQHIGQHGSADYTHCVNITIPAKPTEYADLETELCNIGYDLIIKSRRPFITL